MVRARKWSLHNGFWSRYARLPRSVTHLPSIASSSIGAALWSWHHTASAPSPASRCPTVRKSLTTIFITTKHVQHLPILPRARPSLTAYVCTEAGIHRPAVSYSPSVRNEALVYACFPDHCSMVAGEPPLLSRNATTHVGYRGQCNLTIHS